MFRVGKSNKPDAAEQPKPAPAQPQAPPQNAPAQSQTAHQSPPQPERPQPVPATTPAADSRAAQPAPAQGAPAPQSQQRAQAETQTSTSRAVTESESLARSLKDGAVGGFVGGTSALSGEINFRGMMRVDGHVTGRVVSSDGTLIVSSGGRVEAKVSVVVAKISGEFSGDITASERVELGRTARVSGDIQTPALVVEDGAIFEGNCRMSRRREAGAGEEARGSKRAA